MQQRSLRTAVAATIGAALLLGSTRDAHAYSVLAHEASVDALWAGGIRPLLQRRFPAATRAQIDNARAYAYGGSISRTPISTPVARPLTASTRWPTTRTRSCWTDWLDRGSLP